MPATPAIDFHCHSHFSDGALSPLELLELAKARDIQQLAITDHDTVRAYSPQLIAAAAAAGITLVNGCEISCQWQRRSIHVVGLNLDLADPGFASCDDAASPSARTIVRKRSETYCSDWVWMCVAAGSGVGRGWRHRPTTLCPALGLNQPDALDGSGL